ncbi:response regulator transcription factor [Paenibacillus alvei]|uniref:Heme response regulator HssR n=1 Tax=Paenibacillus alvei TaxID=44250 RepID=A0ABT4GT25_PAEAL|nr:MULTISPECIES: response regulator transcription factor [Paenibacillus]EJW18044.1 heme response regulator HssR [Paenibacillus alvei DSM 29]MCY7487390.1 response regulator transcription factor [Paenibacillus alvei]MCY9542100.1 response regulator transcription factor [Paenibacillus alvei]MCY9703544.1 response regulator transcription factor [Paenibacillus alvei]MCY9732425.1 response regulator transcription factor [Paenibacillus alvei]
MRTILVADDDENIVELIGLYLRAEGFHVIEARDGIEALRHMDTERVDLVILDIMMPSMDGWELCAELRRQYPDLPILMVTAKGEPGQKVRGFQLGTDDYMTKPFDPMELVMRVKALLRRYRIAFSQVIQLGPLRLDRSSYKVMSENDELAITLPLKEFELLFKLASCPGQILTREQLIHDIWGIDYTGDDRTVDVHIKRLRERFADYSEIFNIVTARSLGYRIEVSHD